MNRQPRNGIEQDINDEAIVIQPHSWLFLIVHYKPCIAFMAIHIQSLRDYKNVQYICSKSSLLFIVKSIL
ncbi:MAG TPA: hypothetical protein VLQ91_21330 [Draconibacterium sp.]|nr:hypothetical protein [Draconibacterium sp.]